MSDTNPRPGLGCRMATQAPEAPIPLDPLALDPMSCSNCGAPTDGDLVYKGLCPSCRKAGLLVEHGSALDPVDVAFLGVEDRARWVCADNDRLRARVEILERHLTRAVESGTIWRNEALADQLATRRASYLVAALFCVLCLAEGWRVMAWIWRMM